jgi:hypothetical protein
MRHTTLGARYRALAARRGAKRAAVAVGHSILRAAYHILTDHQPYDERLHLPKVPRPPTAQHLLQQLRALGFEVAITRSEVAV